MIHECFCCNRGFAAGTSLDAGARYSGRRARHSVGQHTVSSMPPSQLRAPVSRDDCTIPRRTIMNHAGSSRAPRRILPEPPAPAVFDEQVIDIRAIG